VSIVIGVVVVVTRTIVVVIVEYFAAARFSMADERAGVPLRRRARAIVERYILVVALI